MKDKTFLGHLMTLAAVLVWGTTFIATKILLQQLQPVEILFYRFLLGYLLLLLLHPHFHRLGSLKEELPFVFCGASGVTLYFLAENTALVYTKASNVGLLVSVAPVLTAIVAHFFSKKDRFTKNILIGFVIAFIGLFLVIFNGSYMLHLNPAGDFLAILAAMLWAFYSNFLKRAKSDFGNLYITRKVFFYGLLEMVPVLLILRPPMRLSALRSPLVVPNLLFLGLIASALCYVLWGTAVSLIGVVRTSSYIYFIPLITLIFAALLLHESITPLAGAGAVFILSGVYISENGFHLPLSSRSSRISDQLPDKSTSGKR